MNRPAQIILLSLLTVCCLSACRSSGPTAARRSPAATADLFTARLKLTAERGKTKTAVRGTVKLWRDTLVQISLTAPILRTEAIRIEVTPAELLVIDRINKQYAIAPADEIARLLGPDVDFHRLQDLLTDAARRRYVRIDRGSPGERYRIELSRVTLPDRRPTAAKPSARYDRRQLTDLLTALEQL